MPKISLLTALGLGVLLLAAACGGGEEARPSPTGTATPAQPSPTSTPIVAESPTPTATPVPTPTPAPTSDPPPGVVAGFLAEPDAGSGEVMLTWTANPEPDVDHYDVYRSTAEGEPYSLLKSVPGAQDQRHPEGIRGTDDYPVAGKYCYFVKAVDAAGNEGPRSRMYCSKAAGAMP